MATSPRILNLTRGFHLKRNQALRAIENCSAVWVEYGKTMRDATLAESIAMRNAQAKDREPLAWAEIPGLTFQHSGHEAELYREMQLVQEANRFAMNAPTYANGCPILATE